MTEDSGDDRPHGDHGSMLDKTVNVEQEQNSNENVERLSQMMLEMKKTSDQQKEAIERITELIGKQKETRESVAKNAKDTFEEPDADMFSIITTICGSKIDVASRNWEILVEEINQHRIKDICIFIVKIEQVLHFGVIIPVVKKILFVTPDQKFEAIFHREISKRWTIHNLYFPKLKIDQTLVTYKLIQLWVRKYIDDEEMKRSLMGNRATYLSGIRSLFNTINEDDVEAYSLLIESRITSQISGKVTGAIMPNVTTNKSNEVTDEEKGKESNDHIIVGQLNPPQRRVEDDFGEWSDKINLYLESNRIPKSMWSNILYSTLNCQDRSAIDAERYLEGGFPHEYDEMMVFLAERSFKRHPVNEFYQFVRKEGVSVQMYFFRLEKIAKIAFNKKSEEERKQLIMSQFIRGIEDERISRKLFKMDRSNKCSLNQILRAAIEIEDEDLFVRKVRSERPIRMMNKIEHTDGKLTSRPMCKRNHYVGKCRNCVAQNCRYHIKEPSCKWCERDICIQHQGYRKPQSENRRPGKEHVTHLLEIMDEEDSEGLWQGSGREHNAEVNLNVIREMYEDVHDCKLKNELNFTTVTHNGTTFEALIDSGSQRSVIAEHVRCKFDPIKTVHQNVQFLGFDNVGMSSMERVTVECYIGEEKIVNDFAVLNIGRYEMIIGNDILREKNMVIDHKNSKLIKLHNLSMDGDQSDNDDIVDSNDVSTLADRECIDREIVDVLEETGIIQPPESTPKIEHEIVTGTSKPITQKPRRYSEKERIVMNEMSKEMEENGIIEKSESDWCSNVVIVPKKNGQYRMCINYKPLNSVTETRFFHLPKIDNIIGEVAGHEIYSKLDMLNGFYQIKLRLIDRPKTAFRIENETYQFIRMPMGLKNAPATFHSYVSKNLWKFDYCRSYMDDIIVFSKSRKEHMEHLKIILTEIKRMQLRLNLRKCKFLKESMIFLGYPCILANTIPKAFYDNENEIHNWFDGIWREAQQYKKKMDRNNIRYANKNIEPTTLQIGDVVRKENIRTGERGLRSKKLTLLYSGTYTVMKVFDNGNVSIKDSSGNTTTIHSSDLVKDTTRSEPQRRSHCETTRRYNR